MNCRFGRFIKEDQSGSMVTCGYFYAYRPHFIHHAEYSLTIGFNFNADPWFCIGVSKLKFFHRDFVECLLIIWLAEMSRKMQIFRNKKSAVNEIFSYEGWFGSAYKFARIRDFQIDTNCFRASTEDEAFGHSLCLI
jgi:hypothetical protein